jgi:hypothetical protein
MRLCCIKSRRCIPALVDLHAARPESNGRRGVKRSDHSLGWGLGAEPDDNVPDVVEFRCAGRSGPG